MIRCTLIAITLLLCGCAGTHGYAAGNNEGAGMGIDVFHARFP